MFFLFTGPARSRRCRCQRGRANHHSATEKGQIPNALIKGREFTSPHSVFYILCIMNRTKFLHFHSKPLELISELSNIELLEMMTKEFYFFRLRISPRLRCCQTAAIVKGRGREPRMRHYCGNPAPRGEDPRYRSYPHRSLGSLEGNPRPSEHPDPRSVWMPSLQRFLAPMTCRPEPSPSTS